MNTIINNRRGFTLLEVLFTVALVSCGLAFLLQAASTGLFAAGINEQELVAANLAQEKTEEIRLKSYDDVKDEARAPVTDFTLYKREVKVTTPKPNLKQAEVDVYWSARGSENKVSLNTYVSDK